MADEPVKDAEVIKITDSKEKKDCKTDDAAASAQGNPVARYIIGGILAAYMAYAGCRHIAYRDQKPSQLEQKVEKGQTPEERYKSNAPGGYTFTE